MKTIKKKTEQTEGTLKNERDTAVVMVSDRIITDLAGVFKVLADPTRLKIINALIMREMCVQDLAALLNMSLPAVSHHLKQLRDSRLIQYRRDGKKAIYLIDNTLLIQLFARGLESFSKEKQ